MKLENRSIRIVRYSSQIRNFWVGKLGNHLEFYFPRDNKKQARAKMERIRALLTKLEVYDS